MLHAATAHFATETGRQAETLLELERGCFAAPALELARLLEAGDHLASSHGAEPRFDAVRAQNVVIEKCVTPPV